MTALKIEDIAEFKVGALPTKARIQVWDVTAREAVDSFVVLVVGSGGQGATFGGDEFMQTVQARWPGAVVLSQLPPGSPNSYLPRSDSGAAAGDYHYRVLGMSGPFRHPAVQQALVDTILFRGVEL
ncbi:hypothetical protein [Tsukamurella spumae]|uniref:Uncharacterized protein n=1 Tax=Tsukamurella spumae TaxID=44753 RepID=A0A846X301_9ACTN|nr:hypothetical protein [Tsukamurella spumae]NKY19533.1 hypothetical protein [Tsukamurella spumae]